MLYKYRIYCITEATQKYVYGEKEPTSCPTDASHKIGNVVITTQIDKPVKRNFRSEMLIINETLTKKWLYPITLTNINYMIQKYDNGDLTIKIGPEMIGKIISVSKPQTNSFIVDQNALSKIALGYNINIAENDLGEVISIGDSIITEKKSQKEFNIGTEIIQNIIIAKHILGPAGNYEIKSNIDIPTGIPLQINCTKFNKSESIFMKIEYLY